VQHIIHKNEQETLYRSQMSASVRHDALAIGNLKMHYFLPDAFH